MPSLIKNIVVRERGNSYNDTVLTGTGATVNSIQGNLLKLVIHFKTFIIFYF